MKPDGVLLLAKHQTNRGVHQTKVPGYLFEPFTNRFCATHQVIEKRMRAQYTALDTVMAQLSTQSSYLTQQIAQFNASSSNK